MTQRDDAADDDDKPASAADLDASLRFVHVLGMQTKLDGMDVRARLDALIEELVARGAISLRGLEERLARTRQEETERQKQQAAVQVGPSVDKYTIAPLPQIDCEARLPLCKARCCQMSFPLSFQDLDEGVVRFDYRRPYVIRQRPDDGYCVHNAAGGGGCQVYAQRPAICRTYDCRTDKRVWLDFDARIPAPHEPPLVQLRARATIKEPGSDGGAGSGAAG